MTNYRFDTFLAKMHCVRANDQNKKPWGTSREVEIYQTWQMRSILSLASDDSQETWIRQGFSTKGGPHSGLKLRPGKTRYPNDPNIAFTIPDLAPGRNHTFEINMYWWESDRASATKKVRAAFTDSAMKAIENAWVLAGEDYEAAKKKVLEWIRESGGEIANAAWTAATAGTTGPMWMKEVLGGLDGKRILELVFEVAKTISGKDDFIQSHKLTIDFARDSGADSVLKWRVTAPEIEVNSGWQVGEAEQKLPKMSAVAGDDKTAIDAFYRFRVWNTNP